MKKNTRSKSKSRNVLESFSSETLSNSTTHSNVLNNTLAPSLDPSASSFKKPSKTKLKLVVSEAPHDSKEHSTMTKNDQKNSVTSSHTQLISTSDPSFKPDFKSPDVMDFYKGWMSFYENQWQIFFKTWSQFLKQPGPSPALWEEQNKEFHHYYTCLAHQFQECASIAHRTTQETIKIIHESLQPNSIDSKSGGKNNTKKSS